MSDGKALKAWLDSLPGKPTADGGHELEAPVTVAATWYSKSDGGDKTATWKVARVYPKAFIGVNEPGLPFWAVKDWSRK